MSRYGCLCVCVSAGGLHPSLRPFRAEGAGRFVNVDQLGQTYSEGGVNALMHKVCMSCDGVGQVHSFPSVLSVKILIICSSLETQNMFCGGRITRM